MVGLGRYTVADTRCDLNGRTTKVDFAKQGKLNFLERIEPARKYANSRLTLVLNHVWYRACSTRFNSPIIGNQYSYASFFRDDCNPCTRSWCMEFSEVLLCARRCQHSFYITCDQVNLKINFAACVQMFKRSNLNCVRDQVDRKFTCIL